MNGRGFFKLCVGLGASGIGPVLVSSFLRLCLRAKEHCVGVQGINTGSCMDTIRN
jgi:hypothetical protein